jgi:hypothetical protein
MGIPPSTGYRINLEIICQDELAHLSCQSVAEISRTFTSVAHARRVACGFTLINPIDADLMCVQKGAHSPPFPISSQQPPEKKLYCPIKFKFHASNCRYLYPIEKIEKIYSKY